jgi:hypothetical protein
MASYLKYRVKKLNGAHMFLPDFINGMLDGIEEGWRAMDYATRTKNEGILIDVVVANYPDIFLFLTTDAARKSCQNKIAVFHDSMEEVLVTAAAALGDSQMFRHLIRSGPKTAWKKSEALGYPLTMAAYTGNLHIVKLLIGLMNCAKVIKGQQDALTLAMSASLSAGRFDVSKYLASVHADYLPVVPTTKNYYLTAPHFSGTLKYSDCYGDWLALAIDSQDVDLVKAILALKHEGGAEIYVEGLLKACRIPHQGIIRLFFEMNLLNINQRLGGYFCGSTPMSIAVCSNKHAAIDAMLELGARMTGTGLVAFMRRRGINKDFSRAIFRLHGQPFPEEEWDE